MNLQHLRGRHDPGSFDANQDPHRSSSQRTNYRTSKKLNAEQSSESIKKINASRWDRQKHSICGQHGNSDRDETSPAMPKCAKESESTAHKATDIVGNTKIRKNPNITFTMHVMTGKQPTTLGPCPQEEQNTSSIKINAAIIL